MAETTREMVVRLTMDAGGFKKTASEINRQIKNIDSEIKGMGGAPGKSKLEEKLGLQQKAVENLQKAVEDARTKLQYADTDAKKLLAAKQLSGLETQLANAEQKAMALKNQLAAANYIKWGGMITGFGRAMSRMGRSFSMYIGAPLAALGISSFNAFKDYEMALARLKSALPDAGEEIERLNQAALEMSETIPVSYEELMAIMTSLAKAGVPVGEIDGMTLALARMSAVTGMTAEEVGTSMVMFMNSMGLPMGNVDQLGAALVRLADESIATEGDIFSMATRMAATSNLAGLSATEVLSLAAAFASMGVEAEAGGSAASKLMKKMQLAAETGKDAEGFAKVMGVSAEQFTAGWNQSPADSMLAFFQGLSDLDASGQTSVLAMLAEMKLTEIRLSNLVALGASNPDMFENLMGSGKEGFAENTALVEKAGTIFETTSGEMDMLANATRNAQADMGENVADTFQPLIDKVGELVGKFGELDEETQTRWVKIGALLVGFGPAAAGIGAAAKGVGALMTALGGITAATVSSTVAVFGAIAGATAGLVALGAITKNIKNPGDFEAQDLTQVQASIDGVVATAEEITPAMQKVIDAKAKYEAFMAAVTSADYTQGNWEDKAGIVAPFAQVDYASEFLAALTSGSLGSLVETMQADMELALGEAMVDAGMQIPNGVDLGIKTNQGGLFDTVSEMATGVDENFSAELGIDSPSTVMRDRGMDIGAGVQLGITDSIPGVSGAMDAMQTQLVAQAAAMGAAVAAAFNSSLNFNLPAVGGGSVTPGGSTIINNNTTLNGPGNINANSVYKLQKVLTDAQKRAARGYGQV